MDIKKTSRTSQSNQNFLLNSASLWLGVTFNATSGEFEAEQSLGATTSGVKVSISQAMRQPEIDGVLVKVIGNDYLAGTEMTIETTVKEWTAANLRAALVATLRDAAVGEAPTGYKVLEPKHSIDSTDYINNIGVVGFREGDNQMVIILMDHGINVNGLTTETANHTEAGLAIKLESRASDEGAVGGSFKIFFPPEPVPVTGVTVAPTTMALTVGGIKAIVPTVALAGATNKDVIWTTANPAIATVDDDGHVTGVAAGVVAITATTVDGGFAASCTVTVS